MRQFYYEYAKAVTPDNSNDLPWAPCRGLLATAAGVIAVTTAQGDDCTIPIAAGIVLPLSVKRVKSTNTTATGIVALY